jgi:hypothetical protein
MSDQTLESSPGLSSQAPIRFGSAPTTQNAFEVELLKHQRQFALSTKRFAALVGGFGCGKSYAIAVKTYMLSLINKGFSGALITRSSAQLRRLLLEVDVVFKQLRVTYRKVGHDELHIDWGNNITSIIYLWITENNAYTRWAGGNLAWVCIDEIDTMQAPADVWAYANDRVRVKAPLLQSACASTPEGLGFLWDFFERQPEEHPDITDRELIRGVTFDNPHLDDSYVWSQIRTRNPHLLNAYIYGHFVNMEGVTVYPHFSIEPGANHSPFTIDTVPAHVKVLHIGMDFNTYNTKTHPYGIYACASVILENGEVHTIDECYGESKTSEAIVQMKERWGSRFPIIFVYPDATGKQERTSAAESDRVQLRDAGFQDQSPQGNPQVRDRVNSLNEAVLDTNGWRRLHVNPATCPILTKCLTRQVYDKNGAPEKDTGFDDPCDAYGYFINVKFPLVVKSAFAAAQAWRQ